MLFKYIKNSLHIPTFWRIITVAAGWLGIIYGMHFWLNVDHGERKIIHMGYMPVITNLASPLLDYASKDGNGVRFKAIKFASFPEMAEALRNNKIQVAFLIAPLSIVLRQQGEDVKVVYIGNRNESTFVVRKGLNVSSLNDLIGRTVAVPLRYSGHNISILKMIEENDLVGRIKVVEMNPPDMAAALASGSLDAYFVGEPFAAQTLKSGDANLLYYVEDVWKYFICNLVLVRHTLIENEPDIVKMLVQGAARSGLWAENNIEMASKIASQYWNQPSDLIEYALMTPNKRIVYDRFVPKQEEMQHLADLMVHFNLLKKNDISGLIDDRFAKAVDLRHITSVNSILHPPYAG